MLMSERQEIKKVDIEEGFRELGLGMTEDIWHKLTDYVQLLSKWNKVHNLTAIRGEREMWIRHILDSLSVARYLIGPAVLDFGSGAGLPGIPLAIVMPHYKFYLLDSNQKKTLFLNQVRLALGLGNVCVINGRMEAYKLAEGGAAVAPSVNSPEGGFSTVVTRATVSVSEAWDLVSDQLPIGGQLLVMKGQYPLQEAEEIKKPFDIQRLVVPYLDEVRHLVRVIK